ncbi:hypothetical protein ASR50_06560 [Streptomyces sp. 4F]|nr:hypothetical protein ASR50_06560 [Streptomyces sp. 4F]
MDGVSTYLALTFGTLLSSQGTDASFVLTLSGFPPGASLRCFQTLSVFFRPPDHRPAGMRKVIRSEDLTSWIAAGSWMRDCIPQPQTGLRLYTGSQTACKSIRVCGLDLLSGPRSWTCPPEPVRLMTYPAEQHAGDSQ